MKNKINTSKDYAIMKENIFEVLMYLFENYMDSDTDLPPTQEMLEDELAAVGFHQHEIDQAFSWLEDLAEEREDITKTKQLGQNSFRIYTKQEAEKIDVEGQGLLLYLENMGVLNTYSRELVIDRIMALDSAEADMEQIRWVILMVLLNQPEHEDIPEWLEDFLLNDGVKQLN